MDSVNVLVSIMVSSIIKHVTLCVTEHITTLRHISVVFQTGNLFNCQNISFKDEYDSVMKFTVELINNRTFANETSLANVKLKLKVICTNCSSDGGEEAYKESAAWGSANNIQISWFIGAMCSSASRKIATGGQSEVLPLISWGSTSTGLSDKIQYPYFSIVIANDGTQSIILSNALRDLKIKTVSVIHSEDSYSVNLALDLFKFFQNTSISNQVLLVKQFNSTSYTTLDYQVLLIDILEAGASSVFLASHETPSKEIFQTAKTFKDFSMHSEDYIWLGADGWVITCYLRDSCIGNCYNSSSSGNLSAYSSLIDPPTCDVCASNYYRLFSRCNQCEVKDNTNEDSVFGILSFIFLLNVFASLLFIKHRMKNVKHSDFKDTDKVC